MRSLIRLEFIESGAAVVGESDAVVLDSEAIDLRKRVGELAWNLPCHRGTPHPAGWHAIAVKLATKGR
jgi:hypothetical protein